MKNIVSWIIVIVIVLGGFILLSNNKSDSSDKNTGGKSSSFLVADKMSYDFGEIDIFGGKVETDFILTNNGVETVTILNGTTSCGCTEGSIDGLKFGMHEGMARAVSIPPGETKTLTAIYDPLAHGPNATGQVTRQLFIKTNSTNTPELEMRISANVVKNSN